MKSKAAKEMPIWLNLERIEEVTARLNVTAFGAFMLLLGHYSIHGPLENNPTSLALIAKMTTEEWSDLQAFLPDFFSVGHDGMLRLKDEERLFLRHDPSH